MSVSADHSELQTVKFRGSDGLTLVADEWNRDAESAASRPSVLFLHGGGQNRYSWKNTCQILADDGLHVVALDSRGHGDSDRHSYGMRELLDARSEAQAAHGLDMRTELHFGDVAQELTP